MVYLVGYAFAASQGPARPRRFSQLFIHGYYGDVSGTTFPVDAEEEDTEMHVSSQGSCKSFDVRYGVPQDDFSPITFVVLFFL